MGYDKQLDKVLAEKVVEVEGLDLRVSLRRYDGGKPRVSVEAARSYSKDGTPRWSKQNRRMSVAETKAVAAAAEELAKEAGIEEAGAEDGAEG